MSWARAAYRSRQFFGALRARVGEEERAEVAAHLMPGEQDLFFSMEVSDQRHALDVFRIVKANGQEDASLLAAALLHDVGKGRISVWQRVVFVLLNAVSPQLLRRLASNDGRGWRGTLARSLDHAERGAALAEAAGSTPETVRLIRLHRAPGGDDATLSMLQAADEAS
jgi:hypothetical protein